ncbi:MAG: DUF488 domain-containing protein [Rhodospirillales bacterium]|nr:DUF488 domain-containing protein [Rhodospirillales bacterium]
MSDLFTIGYQASTLARVIASLRAAGVRRLIDVRAVAASRKPGFSKRVLAASLEAAGIAYHHLQPLGTPKAGRQAVRSGHPEVMRRIYAAHMRADAPQAALAEARALAAEGHACLLCFEHDPAECHRRLVAEMIVTETGQRVIDLMPAEG